MPLTLYQVLELAEADGLHPDELIHALEWHETGADTSSVEVRREPLGEVHLKVRAGKAMAAPPAPAPETPQASGWQAAPPAQES